MTKDEQRFEDTLIADLRDAIGFMTTEEAAAFVRKTESIQTALKLMYAKKKHERN